MNNPDNYAVIGFPIHHSKSPRIHALFAEETAQNMSYLAQEVRPENFTSAVNEFFEKYADKDKSDYFEDEESFVNEIINYKKTFFWIFLYYF